MKNVFCYPRNVTLCDFLTNVRKNTAKFFSLKTLLNPENPRTVTLFWHFVCNSPGVTTGVSTFIRRNRSRSYSSPSVQLISRSAFYTVRMSNWVIKIKVVDKCSLRPLQINPLFLNFFNNCRFIKSNPFIFIKPVAMKSYVSHFGLKRNGSTTLPWIGTSESGTRNLSDFYRDAVF